MKRKVDAVVTYQSATGYRFATIHYQVEHWEEAMTMLFATVEWQEFRDRAVQVMEITFYFSDPKPAAENPDHAPLADKG